MADHTTPSRQRRYPPELKERAVRLVDQATAEGERHGAITRVAHQLGIGPESVRGWVPQARVDRGEAGGLTTAERARMKELERENRELRRANEILKSAGQSYDNALAETVNGLYKAELIRRHQGAWSSVEQVEAATAAWVAWWNTTRLHEACGYVPPRSTRRPTMLAYGRRRRPPEIQSPGSPRNPVRFSSDGVRSSA